MAKQEQSTIDTRVPIKMRKKAEAHAEMLGCSLADIMRFALGEYFQNHKLIKEDK